METKEIIEVVEKAIGENLNEDTIGAIVDKRLEAALKPLEKKQVITGDLPGEAAKPKVTLSQFLGDVRRACGAQLRGGEITEKVLRFMEPRNMVFAESGAPAERMPADIRKDLYESGSAAGGYLVPTEQSAELLNVASELYSVVPGMCRPVPMRARQITFPTLSSGLTAYWIPEATDSSGKTVDGSDQAGGERIRSSAVFGQMAIVAHVCAAKVVISNQLLDDADPSVDAVIRGLFAECLGDAWDDACLTGAGSALDPITGLDNLITTNVLAAGAQFNFDDVIDLLFAVLDQDSKANPAILGTTKAEKVLMKLKDDNGQYVYKRPREAAGVPDIWGHNFLRDGNISNVLGAGGNETRLYAGDFRRHGYAGRRQGVIVKANPWSEPYFSYGQTCFMAEFRVGFNVDAEKFFAYMDGVPTS